MDVQKIAREIGLFETALNLVKVSNNNDVMLKVGAFMPLPGIDIENRIQEIANWLLSFGKSKYMFLTPEIALIEKMAKLSDDKMEIILAIPSDIDAEAKERLKNNRPRGITITMLEEPFFPEEFLPVNGMMVICGYLGGGRTMIFPDTYRMVEHYSGFLGKKVFVPYVEIDIAARYEGWMEMNQQRLSAEWRGTL